MRKILFIYRLIWIIAISFLIVLKKPFYLSFLAFGLGMAVDGILESVNQKQTNKVKIGNSQFSLEIPQYFLGFILAGITLGIVYYNNSIETRQEKQSDDLEIKIQEIVEQKLQSTGLSEDEKMPTSDKVLLYKASEKYNCDEFENCLKFLDDIKSSNESVLECKAYLKILCLFKLYTTELRYFNNLNQDNVMELENLFNRYIEKYKDNTKFSIIYYHYGHFIWKVKGDREKALEVFNDIIKNYYYSSWIQGALFYSAIINKQANTKENNLIAIERLKILEKKGGALKILETGETVDATKYAVKFLRVWDIPMKDLASNEEIDPVRINLGMEN